MGGAMLARWQELKLADEWIVIDPASHAANLPNTEVYASIDELPENKDIDIVVFAVKPQTLPSIIGEYARFAKHACFISIAAGAPISFFAEHLGSEVKITRAMPNTPALIGKGMTVAVSRNVDTEKTAIVTALLEAIGKLIWVDDENLLNPVTALSGSGPAYVFLLIEAMTQAGIHIGLPDEMASILARETVIGSAALAESEAAVEASTLRKNVTSPGGTTAAALSVLMNEPGMQALFNNALMAATKRAEELSKN